MKSFRGFTMIEMIIVVAVIGLLVGIVLPNVANIRNRSKDEKIAAELGLIEQSLYKYKELCGMYPLHKTGGVFDITANQMPNGGTCNASIGDFLPSSIKNKLPEDLRYFALKRAGVQSARCTSFFLSAVVSSKNSVVIKRMESRGWKWEDHKSEFYDCGGSSVIDAGNLIDHYYVMPPTPN